MIAFGSPEWEAWWQAEVVPHTWTFVCIGTGPGPKNVMARDETGRPIVFSYRNWKRLQEEAVSDQDNAPFVVSLGIVQQFKKDDQWKPVVTTNDVNGKTVSQFTIKTITQKLVSVSLWPELAHLVPHVAKGAFVAVEGKMRENVSNGVTYYNLSATNIVFVKPVEKAEREVVNPTPAPAADPTLPAAPAPAASAPQIF